MVCWKIPYCPIVQRFSQRTKPPFCKGDFLARGQVRLIIDYWRVTTCHNSIQRWLKTWVGGEAIRYCRYDCQVGKRIPFWSFNMTIEKSTMFDGKTHFKWPFSIAITCYYQRVSQAMRDYEPMDYCDKPLTNYSIHHQIIHPWNAHRRYRSLAMAGECYFSGVFVCDKFLLDVDDFWHFTIQRTQNLQIYRLSLLGHVFSYWPVYLYSKHYPLAN